MEFSEQRLDTSNPVADLFVKAEKGPKFDDKNNLFTGDGHDGSLQSTAQADYSLAYEKGFSSDFYFQYQYNPLSEYAIFSIVMDNLEGFNPKANSGGLSSRAIRNDRENLYVNGNQVFGSSFFNNYKSGSRTMVWYRVDGRTFVNCDGCGRRVDLTKWVGHRQVFPIFSHHNVCIFSDMTILEAYVLRYIPVLTHAGAKDNKKPMD